MNPAWRAYLPVEMTILGAYGVGLLLFPLTFGGFWPWPIDAFHAQVYSAIFLAGAGGTYLVWRSAPREELLVLGLAQFLVGLLAVLGLFITDAAVHRIDWTAAGTLCWLALFGWIGISGILKLCAAPGILPRNRHRSQRRLDFQVTSGASCRAYCLCRFVLTQFRTENRSHFS
ncbi:hypothetical protein [Mesorhizobium sp. C268A]|uniref:hypothetical protein n=1 Tax=Mesorhizobium sp. C268A TaxID=2956826 RepID=UPI0033380158